MKRVFYLVVLLALAAALVLGAVATPALADSAPATAAATKFNLDTPISDLVANPGAKAVLDTDLPGLTTHPQFELFKSMSLTALSGMAPDKLPAEALAKTEADLAKIK